MGDLHLLLSDSYIRVVCVILGRIKKTKKKKKDKTRYASGSRIKTQ